MFLFKRISKTQINQSYSCLQGQARRAKHISININDSEKENVNRDNGLEAIFKQYEDKLLFNTIIESNRLKLGYRTNKKVMVQNMRKQKELNSALRTIQPLPISLKYLNESSLTQQTENLIQDSLNNPVAANETSAYFPYETNTGIFDVEDSNLVEINESNSNSIGNEIIARWNILRKANENWMTYYNNYEYDLIEEENSVTTEEDTWEVNYGTPDPNSKISKYPCGGCGAHLHCKDTAIPGYIPSEIFNNCFKRDGDDLSAVICQRCHFLKEYNIALQVRVSPDDYPKVLKTISLRSALVVLMVDLTDIPCSIWPGISDILGPKTPIVIVGNKIDLIPRDNKKFLHHMKKVLIENVKLSGFASANVQDVVLISAKTGYGVENLITSLQQVWRYKGDVYLIGCTNVGKSSLFNALLQSDYCKIQAADLIQRATTSRWPGTTLNLLKFPITRFSSQRMSLREIRLKKLQSIEAHERKIRSENLQSENSAKYATLIGYIGRSLTNTSSKNERKDDFGIQGYTNLSGKVEMGINDQHPNYVLSKWCYDTPGVVHFDQILHMLTAEELVKTIPKQLIRAETFCVKPGTTLFIAGLARLDYVEGPNSVRLTVFRSSELPITVCKLNEADALYQELLGSELFAVPICVGDRITKWPGLQLAKSITINGTSWTRSTHDIVLSSAGWIAINCGLHKYQFEAWTPEKRGVHIRTCLLPDAVTLRGSRIRDSVAYKKHKFI